MNLPFCDSCPNSNKCKQDLILFEENTGNKRIPPEQFCKNSFEKSEISFDDFYRKHVVQNAPDIQAVSKLYPEFKDMVTWEPLDSNVTLMITEKCNLKCSYCYEVFSGNMKARSMTEEIMRKAVDFYFPEDGSSFHWDIVGGEVFVEFELLKKTVDYILQKYREKNICSQKITISLCSNGTHFGRPEIREWCEWMKDAIGNFSVGISLDGIKECHDLCRNNSFDSVMEYFDWWRNLFPNGTVKGTISPKTMGSLFENVKFYHETLGLPEFYINPTFEGPWTDKDAEVYLCELLRCAEYFLDHPEFDLLNKSNIFLRTDRRDSERDKQNWCGCGIYMRAVSPDGTIYPCLRAATSQLLPLGHIDTGENKERVIPFLFYTSHNEDKECETCKYNCPSCVIQWMEDTGDIYKRSKNMCQLTKVCAEVSKFYRERMFVEHPEVAKERFPEVVENGDLMD